MCRGDDQRRHGMGAGFGKEEEFSLLGEPGGLVDKIEAFNVLEPLAPDISKDHAGVGAPLDLVFVCGKNGQPTSALDEFLLDE